MPRVSPKPIPSQNGHTKVLHEALRLHALGYSVVPVEGKAAFTPGWNENRFTESELEAALKGTKRNIAIALNHSELIDVECDSDEAETNLQEMFDGEIPPTPTWKSSRGKHRLFCQPQGLPKLAVVKINGVEFRIGNGKGALSVVPPSIHPDGTHYEWITGLSLGDVEPAELPPEIVQRLCKGTTASTPHTDGDIPEGKRNDELFKVGCKLAKSGIGLKSVEAALQAENTARCKPPLSVAEVARIAKSSRSQGTQSTQTNAEILIGIALTDTELWHTPDAAYATIERDGHRENWPLRSKSYRQWLAKQFYDQEKNAVGSQTMQDVLNTLEGMAMFDGPEYPRHIRIADHAGRIYIDLADDEWRAIEVAASGWRVVAEPPVRFCRPPRMLSLPIPERGGSVAELRRFVNVADNHWPLILGWIVASLRPTGPYPILKTIGEQGSSKTTLARVLRAFIDPNTCPTRGTPRSERDLMIAAENGWVCCFDNLSHVTTELSDALCRLSTGGGLGVRTHYENSEETVFHSKRPVILNGIEDIGMRSDLMDRALIVELPRLSDADRLPEQIFDRQFAEKCPRIFGAILDAMVTAVKNLPAVEKSGKAWPRMADFAQWATAAEPALGLAGGAFLKAYSDNRETANQTALESSPVISALLALLKKQKSGKFEGTATDLLAELCFQASCIGQDTRAKGWPQTARPLAGVLTRLAPNLRQSGISVEQGREGNGKTWKISMTLPSASSQSTHSTQKSIPPLKRPPVPETAFEKHFSNTLISKR
ncbi:MAG: hypothetical protein EXS09_17440 [Gemmataceae bacterium]|nr:hypothetical protein [Gemmataceae bacterium]